MNFVPLWMKGIKNFGFEFIAPSLVNLKTIRENPLQKAKTLILFDQYPQICLRKTSERIFNEADTEIS